MQEPGEKKIRKPVNNDATPSTEETGLDTGSSTKNTVDPKVEAAPLPSASTAPPEMKDSLRLDREDSVAKSKTDTSDVKKKIVKAKNPWSLELKASAGISNTSRSFFNSLLKTEMDMATPTGIGAGGPQTAPVITPEGPKAGPAFSIGMAAVRKLDDRWTFSAGLNYAFLSNRLSTGTQRQGDTTIRNSSYSLTVNNYYEPGNSSFHSNRYHMIELPVMMEWRIRKKSPLTVVAGLSAGLLLTNDALLYNSNSNVYYNQPSALNRFQVSGISGLSWQWNLKHQKVWKLGPYVRYAFTAAEKKDISPERHFISAGLQTSISL
jgi:hypothetical protein